MQERKTNPWRFRRVAETCEPRLVLSAQALAELVPHGSLTSESWLSLADSIDSQLALESGAIGPFPSSEMRSPVENLPISPHLESAHRLADWGDARSNFGLSGGGQTVAVIDSGIAWDHQALGGGFGSLYRVVGGWDFAENDANPYDDAPAGFHGTHVAGIIGSNDPQHTGVAPNVDLVSLRVFDDAGNGQLAWVEQSLRWVHENQFAFENPITTVNLSIGSDWNGDGVPPWAILEEEIQQLHDAGIVVVASAGNAFAQYQTPGLSYPASSPFVIPVASANDDGTLSGFSQRNESVIVAPGSGIVSSVPDYVLGSDGVVDDFSAASGTSMAAPYVSGAAVLIREAYELVGQTEVGFNEIYTTLRETAESIFDQATQQTYRLLNVHNALASILPADSVGDTVASASVLDTAQESLNSWINTLSDRDFFQYTPLQSGVLRLTVGDGSSASIATADPSGFLNGATRDIEIAVQAGEPVHFGVWNELEIGPVNVDVSFSPLGTSNGGGEGADSTSDLGVVSFQELSTQASASIRFVADNSGPAAVRWEPSSTFSSVEPLRIFSGNTVIGEASLEGGSIQLTAELAAGSEYRIETPSHDGTLTIGNNLQRSGAELLVHGTNEADNVVVNVAEQLQIQFNTLSFEFTANEIREVRVDTQVGNDSIHFVGSHASEQINLRSGELDVASSVISVSAVGVENISIDGNGGPDRAYLYDTEGDDVFRSRPFATEMTGNGFRYDVANVPRIFVHATSGGEDLAFLHDSSGDDILSIRPQFSSMRGADYFSYVAGFERVYSYGTDGVDVATLYDSAGNDRFNTSRELASITGPGFASFTRGFDQVDVYATAGGSDTAAIYANSSALVTRGFDYTSFSDESFERVARGFESVEVYRDGIRQSTFSVQSIAAQSADQSADHASASNVVDILGHASRETPAVPLPSEHTEFWQPATLPVRQLDASEQTTNWMRGTDYEFSLNDAQVGFETENNSLARPTTESLSNSLNHITLDAIESLEQALADINNHEFVGRLLDHYS